ncbi:hypothetical protein D3C78_600750 [compost metagenome]
MRAVREQTDRSTQLIAFGGDQTIECCAAIQDRVGRLAALIVSRLTVSNEIREVLRPAVGHGVRTLEPVGRGFEHVLVVGAAAGRHRVQNRLQLSQRIRVIEVHRHRLVDLGVEVHQEDVHRARVAAQALLEGVEHRRQRVLGRVDRRGTHTAGAVDHEGDVVVGARHHGQAANVGDDDVIAVGAGEGVIGRSGSDGVIDRWVHGHGDLRSAAGRTAEGLGGGRGHSQVELAVVVRWWSDRQRVEAPAGHVGLATGRCDRECMSRAVGEHRADWHAADLQAQAFRAVGVGQRSGDGGQFHTGAFGAGIEFVTVVVALAIGAVQVGHGHAGIHQIRHAGVNRYAGTAQVGWRAAIDRQIDVIAARATLVVVVDVQGVVAAGGRGVRTIEVAARAPGDRGDVLAADSHQQAVIANTAEGVGLAGFEVDQAGGFRRRTGGHATVGLHVGHGACGVRCARGVDHVFQRGGVRAAAAGAQARQTGPDFLDQPGGLHAVVGNAQGRGIRHRSDVDLDRAGVAQCLAVGWLELDLCVVGLIVAKVGTAVSVHARFVGIRHEAQFASVDVGLAEGLVGGDIFPGRTVQVLQFALDRQLGDFHAQTGGRAVDVADAEGRPAEDQRRVFGAGDVDRCCDRCIIDRHHVDRSGRGVGVVAAIGHRHGDGTWHGARVFTVVGEGDVLDLLHVVGQRRATRQGQGDGAIGAVGIDGDAVDAVAQVQRITVLTVGQHDGRAGQQGAVRVGDAQVGIADRHARTGSVFGERHLVVGPGGAAGVVGVEIQCWRCIVVDDRSADAAIGRADRQVLEVAAGGRVDLDHEVFGVFGDPVIDGRNVERHAAGIRRDLDRRHTGEVHTIGCGARVGQGYGHFTVSRVGQREGVMRCLTLDDRCITRDADSGDVTGVGRRIRRT